MFHYIPDCYKGEFAETEEEATRWVQAAIAGKRPDARRPPELLTRDVVARAIRARGARRPRHAARRRVSRYRLAPHARGDQEEAAQHVSPVQGAGRRRYHDGADGSRPDVPLHDGRRARERRNAGIDRARLVRGRRSAAAACTGRIGWAATRSRTCWCSASGPASSPPSRPTRRSQGADQRGRSRARGGRVAALVRRRRRARIRTRCTRNCEQLMQRHVGIVRSEDDLEGGAGEARRTAAAGGQGQGRRQHSVQSRLAPGARSEEHARYQRGGDARLHWSARKAAARTRARIFRIASKEWGKVNLIVRQARDGDSGGAGAAAGAAGGAAAIDQR